MRGHRSPENGRAKAKEGPADVEPALASEGSLQATGIGSDLERGTLPAVCRGKRRKRVQVSRGPEGTPRHPHQPSWSPEDRNPLPPVGSAAWATGRRLHRFCERLRGQTHRPLPLKPLSVKRSLWFDLGTQGGLRKAGCTGPGSFSDSCCVSLSEPLLMDESLYLCLPVSFPACPSLSPSLSPHLLPGKQEHSGFRGQ